MPGSPTTPPYARHRDFMLEGLPEVPNGWPAPVSITELDVDGHFDWTYTANNFQNSVGTLVDLTLPITSCPLSSAIVSVTNSGISGTNPGNVQNLSYNWSIVFSQPLTGPTQTTSINPSGSSFNLTGI